MGGRRRAISERMDLTADAAPSAVFLSSSGAYFNLSMAKQKNPGSLLCLGLSDRLPQLELLAVGLGCRGGKGRSSPSSSGRRPQRSAVAPFPVAAPATLTGVRGHPTMA